MSQPQQPRQPREEKRIPEDEEDSDEEEEERKERLHRGFNRPKLDAFSFGETGPFEPLVLSDPGEIPVVQVFFFWSSIASILGFLVSLVVKDGSFIMIG